MLLFPNLWLLSGTAYGLHQNVYGIDFPEEKRMVWIDCGLDERDLAAARSVSERFGLTDRRVTDVFLTHCHYDHAGNAAALARTGAEIRIGAADAESVARGDAHTLDFAYGRPFPRAASVLQVSDGERFPLPEGELVAHHTPGHTRGSVCYELRRNGMRILFTGDFLQVDPTGNVIPGIKVDPAYSYEDYAASAERMKDLRVDAVLCGHYPPMLAPDANLLGGLYRELLVNRSLYA